MAVNWGYTVRVNHKEIEDLRNLTADDCLIVTELELMRGVDYRIKKDGKTTGIHLLLARDFPHTRAYI